MCCHERPFHVPSRDADCLISSFWRRSWWSCRDISLRPNNSPLPGRSCSCSHASTDAVSTTGTLPDAVSRGHFDAASIVRRDIPVQGQTKEEQKGKETSWQQREKAPQIALQKSIDSVNKTYTCQIAFLLYFVLVNTQALKLCTWALLSQISWSLTKPA